MGLSSDLLSQFARITNDTPVTKTETTVYGTAVEFNGKMYARLDGSDRLTPMDTTAVVKPGDRVTVLIKNHSATITGNITSPSARNDDLKETNDKVGEIGNKITEFEIVIADKVSVKDFDAQTARITELVAENVTIKKDLTAAKATIETLEADNVTINDTLTANKASIEKLETTKLDADVADLKYATIDNLSATNAVIRNLEADYGDFKNLTTENFAAQKASIEDLDVKKLDATEAELKYANIDFSNIGKAAIEQFYATSGIIKDLVIGDQTITGELVGVTIKGDLIEGNTIVADKLVVKGEDGLYYKLNTDGVTTEAEQTDYNSLKGSILQAKSVTAEKISVKDLVAFGATIGGFHIGDHSLYSGVKESATNTTRGVFLGDDGQVAFGDANNFIKYYKDNDGKFHLKISADSLTFGTSSGEGSNIEDVIDDIKNDVNNLRDEITTLLRIESSRGTVFKNNTVSTVLSVVIYHGTQRITDSAAMKSTFGDGAYLQWKWQRMNDDTYGVISASDSRIGNGGFTFTLTPDDVDIKVTFMCELMV